MKEELIELWCKATKEKELEEYTEDTRNLYDYTMKMAECIKDTKESSDAIIIEQKEEIERLNNIINELEKDIRNQRELSLPISEYSVGMCDVLIHRLNLLKGSDKE